MPSSNKIMEYLWPAIHLLALLIVIQLISNIALAQWVNHYPKLDDFGHHVYIKQHEFPILTHGITALAPSPYGKNIAIASKSWLWLPEIESDVAKRLTNATQVSARNAYGEQLMPRLLNISRIQ